MLFSRKTGAEQSASAEAARTVAYAMVACRCRGRESGVKPIMKPDHWHIDNEHKRNKLIEFIKDKPIPDLGYIAWFETGKRTTKQSNSMWLYCTQLAEILNDAGLTLHMEYLGKSCEVEWNKDLVMDRLWRPVQLTITGQKSTTKIDRAEVNEIFGL